MQISCSSLSSKSQRCFSPTIFIIILIVPWIQPLSAFEYVSSLSWKFQYLQRCFSSTIFYSNWSNQILLWEIAIFHFSDKFCWLKQCSTLTKCIGCRNVLLREHCLTSVQMHPWFTVIEFLQKRCTLANSSVKSVLLWQIPALKGFILANSSGKRFYSGKLQP